MTLLGLATGDRVDLHVTLFSGELAALDAMCAQNKCTRGTIIGALIARYQHDELAIPPGADHARRRPRPKP